MTDLLVRPGTLFIYQGRVYEVLEVGNSLERRLVLEHRKRAPADPLPEARRLEDGSAIHVEVEPIERYYVDGEDRTPPTVSCSAAITDIVDENRYVRAYYYLTGTVERKA